MDPLIITNGLLGGISYFLWRILMQMPEKPIKKDTP